MNTARAISIFASLALHAGAIWWWQPQSAEVPLAGGEPEGENVVVDLVAAGPLVEEIQAEEPPTEPMPPEPPPVEPEPEPLPPEPEPLPPEPEPEPEPLPPPPVPAPDVMEEPAPPKMDPPKPKPRPAARAAKSDPPKPRQARAASAPAAAGGAPGASGGSTDGESRARYKNRVKPAYPDSLRRSGAEGRVQVLVVVSADGRAISARISRSSGNALFDQAALTAARASSFYPKKSFGVPVQDTVLIPYTFSIVD